MIEAICPQCKVHYYGQALSARQNQICMKCGNPLAIKRDDCITFPALSAVRAGKYHFSEAVDEEWENLCALNLLIYLNMN
jgi:hypothetical protein